MDPKRERKLQKFSIQWEGRGELQHARLDMTLQKSRKLFLTFVFYCTPAVIWFPQYNAGRAKDNLTTSPFLRDTSNIFLQCRSPLLRYFLSALKSIKWSTHSQSLIKIKGKCFQQNPLCYCTLMATETANLFRDALTMKHHLKMHLQLCIFHFNHSIVNYTSASPWKKEVGCQRDVKGERKERNFYQTKELQETDITSLEAIPSPLNIFYCIQTYQNPNKGHFSLLKYEPSANLITTREKYDNLADAKQSRVK